MGKIYLKKSVYDAALERIGWLYDEFDNVYVTISGGKDSTVVLNLALEVAEQKGRLPVRVLFIDQEGEWEVVIDHLRQVLNDSRIDPYWLQVPIKIFNATSHRSTWLQCWDPNAKEWMRDKEENSIHDNRFGTDRFKKMFPAFLKTMHPREKACFISGVRCEESPSRQMGLTQCATYKGETWGRKGGTKYHYAFYPIYDWTYRDVWKAIYDGSWPYCPLYDYMYQYGIPTRDMRVSNLNHENAVQNLYFMQEIEPHTWEKLTQRIHGINTAGTLSTQWGKPKKLPYMFDSWLEYRDHLLENLIQDEETREIFRKQFASNDKNYKHNDKVFTELIRTEINALIVNDYHGTKLQMFHASHSKDSINAGKIRKNGLKKSER